MTRNILVIATSPEPGLAGCLLSDDVCAKAGISGQETQCEGGQRAAGEPQPDDLLSGTRLNALEPRRPEFLGGCQRGRCFARGFFTEAYERAQADGAPVQTKLSASRLISHGHIVAPERNAARCSAADFTPVQLKTYANCTGLDCCELLCFARRLITYHSHP